MTFFDPTPKPKHRCPLPEYGTQHGWRCDCGKAYVREMLPARDVNPGESPWQWKRSSKHDAPQERDWLRAAWEYYKEMS